MSGPVSAYFVCGGRWHDFDFARVEILKLLGEHEEVRTRVAEDFRDIDAIAASDFLVTYTCDLDALSEEEQQALAIERAVAAALAKQAAASGGGADAAAPSDGGAEDGTGAAAADGESHQGE